MIIKQKRTSFRIFHVSKNIFNVINHKTQFPQHLYSFRQDDSQYGGGGIALAKLIE